MKTKIRYRLVIITHQELAASGIVGRLILSRGQVGVDHLNVKLKSNHTGETSKYQNIKLKSNPNHTTQVKHLTIDSIEHPTLPATPVDNSVCLERRLANCH